MNADVTPLENFNANPSIDLWWQAKNRRPNQHQRKTYKKRKSVVPRASTSTSVEPEYVISVDTSSENEFSDKDMDSHDETQESF